MSTASTAPEQQQVKIREFMSILPVTLAIAGLATATPGQYLNEGQMEARANTLRTAYKIARQLLVEVGK